MERQLMKGNEAIAEAAIRAGCRYFFGYPITPQNEIPEYMSSHMPKVGGCYLQAESETAAINMVYGASAAGQRVMTSSSSPGISLKQEGISFLACTELPAVIVNIMRTGPGLGGILSSQGDYFQAVKGGGHGDYRIVVLAPASVQEAVELVMEAFEIADQYRTPVMLMGDGMIGTMMEPVVFGAPKKRELPKKDWACTGWDGESRNRAVINSLYIEPELMNAVINRLAVKYDEIKKNETRCEEYMMDDANICITAYGSVGRIAKSAVRMLRSENIRAGLIRPITLWPFPEASYQTAVSHIDAFLTVEMSTGQMVEDVRLAVNGKKPVDFLGVVGGFVPTPEEIVDRVKTLMRVEQ